MCREIKGIIRHEGELLCTGCREKFKDMAELLKHIQPPTVEVPKLQTNGLWDQP